MSWVVEWIGGAASGDMPHHSEQDTLEAALSFADERLRSGSRVLTMSGPSGESWGETHVKVEVEKARLANCDEPSRRG